MTQRIDFDIVDGGSPIDMQVAGDVEALSFTVEPAGKGTTDYTELENKPSIEGVTLVGDVSLEDIGAADAEDVQAAQETAEAALTASGKAVRFDAAQTLTDAQKVQARGNVGAADAAEVSELKSAVINVSDLFIYEQPSITKDSGMMLLPIAIGDSVTIERIDGQTFLSAIQLRFYDAAGAYIGYKGTAPYTATARTFTYDQTRNAVYIGIYPDIAANSGTYRVINNSSRSYVLQERNERISADTLISDRLTVLDSQAAKADIINRFNKATISTGKYININNGSLASNDAFFASDYIYVGDLSSVTVSYTHLFGWYNATKEWIGHPDTMNSASNDLTFTIPENAVYLRFSAYNTNLDKAQIGEAISRSDYIEYGKYTLPDLVIKDAEIVVDASGSGDYTSLTKALYDNVDSGVSIVVKPGQYDIVSEYVAIFGQSAVDSMADADTATFNGFQFGAIIRNRKITFEPGAHVVCDWTGHTVDGTHRFSALRVDYNCEIIGLDLLSVATFYAIHDDYGVSVPYTVRYVNCRVEGQSLYNSNCIGGGCKQYSRHIIENCYFNNNLTGSATVRYHNTNADGAEPEIYVSNCYFNNWFTPRWYGQQTSKMRVYVNNCEARSIHKMAESSSYNVDNVELYKWCNTETNPVT